MLDAANHLKSFLKRDEDDIVNVTGEVLNYQVKSSYCKKCQCNTGDHDCNKNHQGSPDSMEKISAAEIFCWSIQKQNLRHTVYIGDCDTNSFPEVREKLKEKFGDYYSVTKEDCIGHIQKHMGAAVLMYSSKNRGRKSSDGKTIGGKGRRTNKIVDSIQNYYGQAIRSNIRNLKATQGAVWSVYYSYYWWTCRGKRNSPLFLSCLS